MLNGIDPFNLLHLGFAWDDLGHGYLLSHGDDPLLVYLSYCASHRGIFCSLSDAHQCLSV